MLELVTMRISLFSMVEKHASCACVRREETLSRLLYLENSRVSEIGMHEQTDLLELCTVHYTTPFFRWDSRAPRTKRLPHPPFSANQSAAPVQGISARIRVYA